MTLCIHVDLKVALFPKYWSRQSVTYFSAAAGENFGLRDSKSAQLCLKLDTRYINNSRHLARKYARIFVRGHYLFREVNSFPRATSSRETLRFSGNKIHCSPRDQSLSLNYFLACTFGQTLGSTDFSCAVPGFVQLFEVKYFCQHCRKSVARNSNGYSS